jgi:hypothetical protein
MFAPMSVAVSPSTLLQLMEHLRDSGGATDAVEAVDAAIRHWIAAQRGAKSPDPAAPRGYQWKSLFLPEGTWLRMAYRSDQEYAIVEGDHIMYRGRAVSPNQFASGHADSVRNAWRDISIRMPGEKNWKMAYIRRRDLLRAERQAQPAAQNQASAIATTVGGSGPTQAPTAAASALSPAPAPAPAPATATASPFVAAPSPQPAATHRDPTPGVGWTLPERRKFRFRLEDVAFD